MIYTRHITKSKTYSDISQKRHILERSQKQRRILDILPKTKTILDIRGWNQA